MVDFLFPGDFIVAAGLAAIALFILAVNWLDRRSEWEKERDDSS